MNFESSLEFAKKLDATDPLAGFRNKFSIPKFQGKETIYLCGNSLGLQPKTTSDYIAAELEDWKNLGVEGHFHSKHPWFEYHKFLKGALVALTGANSLQEVTPMGSLTTNLHLLLVSFYKPGKTRFKILMESGAFPSDQYAIETQCLFHGFDPNQAIIEVTPGAGSHILKTADIIRCIEENQDQLALVLFSGIQYYSGQFFDIESITKAGHHAGAIVGWDLAHAIGNVPLFLHRHQVDFAVWCTYKYLNSGPGATAGIFVHENHGKKPEGLQRFGGWWGHHEEERFQMKKGFKPMAGADGWQLSNANVLSMAAQKASLDIFEEAGINRIREKSLILTGFLEFLLLELAETTSSFSIITPFNPQERGAQLSLLFRKQGRQVFQGLTDHGMVVDWREPDTIRVAPVALYNSYQEVFEFAQVLKSLLR